MVADINALGQAEPTMYEHQMDIYKKKFESEGFATEVIDGHDVPAILAALDLAKATKGKPQAIVAHTIKGYGFSEVAGKQGWHGKPFSKDQLAAAIKELGGAWDIPPDPGKSYARKSLPRRADFPALAAPDYDPAKPFATREAYGNALKRIGAVNPRLIDLSGDVDNSTFSAIFAKAILIAFSRPTSLSRTWSAWVLALRCVDSPLSSTHSLVFSRAQWTKLVWRRSAGRISACADRIAASPLVRTVRRKWVSKTSQFSAR